MKALQNDLYILMDLEQRFELSFFIFFVKTSHEFLLVYYSSLVLNT